VRVVDGSGLSRLDRLTANAVAGILRAAWNDPAVRPAFVAALPVAGVQRHARGPAAEAGGSRARAGEDRDDERRVSALGYVTTRFLFTVLQNGHPLQYWWARRAQDRFVNVLAAQ
jgi:D-alanyl-D-alanine carboxypeptidase